jgi:S-adenosylmethionine decarboxylase
MDKRLSGYGPHLTLDLSDCDQVILDSLEKCFNLLNMLPGLIGMTKITVPHVFRYSGKIPDDFGITGFVVIAESHISLHTYPKKGYVFVDVFSCNQFDTKKTETIIKKFFRCKKCNSNVVLRGKDFPRG